MISRVRPDHHARPEYAAAFAEVARRIADSLATVSRRALPIKMFVAGGAALHFYTGERVSKDIDAAFSHRIALPDDLEVSYRDADGAARLLYFDRQYNDSFGLLHEDAYDDSLLLTLATVNAAVLEVRLLSPLDLAVSKLGRYASQDRDDIASLARHKLIDARALCRRAEAALTAYVGNTDRVQTSTNLACRVVEDEEMRRRVAARRGRISTNGTTVE